MMAEYTCPQCGASAMGVRYHPDFETANEYGTGFTVSDHCFLCGYESPTRPLSAEEPQPGHNETRRLAALRDLVEAIKGTA